MKRGVTLFEILIAALVMSIGLVAAINAISSTTLAARRNADYQRALMAARSKLDEVLKEPVVQTGTDQGQGVDDTTDYDWFVNVEPTSNAALVRITVRAQNRTTKLSVDVSTLRRPDLNTAPDGTSTIPGAETEATTGTTGAGTLGGAL